MQLVWLQEKWEEFQRDLDYSVSDPDKVSATLAFLIPNLTTFNY